MTATSEILTMLDMERERNDYHNRIRETIRQKLAAGSEDTEPEGDQVGFLSDPKSSLYPPLFGDGDKILPDAAKKIKAHVLNAIEFSFKNPDNFIYFTIYGSGISYNWDEGGDLDLQLWVDFDKFQNQDDSGDWTADDLLAEIRRQIAPVNFPTFKDISIPVPNNPKEECDGTMMIQYYAKLGTGSKEENLASQPYSCYDMETNEWLVHPKPMRPTFYGEHFVALMPKAEDMATQAEQMLDEYERNLLNWQFWFSLYSRYKNPSYQKQYQDAQRNVILEKAGIKRMFDAVFGGRAEAYQPGGKGLYDERDIMQKLLEVWGIFQRLKHFARAPLPWDETDLPEAPSKDSAKSDSEKQNRDAANDTKDFAITHTSTVPSSSGWVKEAEAYAPPSATKSPEHDDPGGWAGIMEKAQRLRSGGQVQVLRNGVQNIVGQVQGDNGTYDTEIWRADPNRNTISLWNCSCPWGGVSWGRTRQFKKYEGRPCAHTLALYWEASTRPLDEEYGQDQQLQIPGIDPYMNQQQQPQQQTPIDLNQALQQTVQPTTMPTPVMPQSQPIAPEDANEQTTITFPGALSHRQSMAERTGDPKLDKLIEEFSQMGYYTNHWNPKMIGGEDDGGDYDGGFASVDVLRGGRPGGWAAGECGQVTSAFVGFLRSRGINAYSTWWDEGQHSLRKQMPEVMPGMHDVPGPDIHGYQDRPYPGDFDDHEAVIAEMPSGVFMIDFTASQYGYKEFPMVQRLDNGQWNRNFSKWHRQGAALNNGDYARINKAMIGFDDRGTQYTVPRNSIVEVIWSDDEETIAIYSLNSQALGPHNARITGPTSDFSWVPRTRGTAPKRR